MDWQNVGEAGEVTVKVNRDSAKIMIGSPSGGIPMSVVEAAYLAVLLDEAIGLAKGSSARIEPDEGL